MTRQSFLLAHLLIAISLDLLVCIIPAIGQTESVIHSFQASSVFDGITPLSGVVSDNNGALYGTTQSGGKYHAGTIYKLVPPGVEGGTWGQNLLYSFSGGNDGAYPSGALVLKGSGKIYGTTQAGGGAQSCGTVYELSPPTKAHSPWTHTVLYSFCSTAGDGNDPIAGLISDNGGRLYGSTYKGGSHKAGNIFVLLPPLQQGGAWRERDLWSFETSSDGELPSPGGLTLDASGALYGALQSSDQGGVNSGSIFRLSPPSNGAPAWTQSFLYSFTGDPDGYGPTGTLVLDSSGTLYGATERGGQYGAGSVFSLTPPTTPTGSWTENVLYSFTGLGDGYLPDSGVVADSAGALYGVTYYGGISSCGDTGLGCGTSYKLVPPTSQGGAWTEETLHSFAGDPDASSPEAPLLVLGTSVYGTTVTGGTGPCSGPVGAIGCGTVFQIAQ